MAVGSIPNAFTKARSGGDSFTGKCNAIESACAFIIGFAAATAAATGTTAAATAADA